MARAVWPSEPPRGAPGSDSPPSPDDDQREAGIVIAIGDVEFGQVVYEALRAASPRMVLVASATLALHELEGLRPALLVVDDELPLVRGLDLAGRVRSERSDADVILLTDDDLVVELVARLRVERVRCLQKPVDLERLRQAVALSLRGLAVRRAGSAYDDLLRELEDQRSRFERRIKNLERRQASSRPPPSEVAAAPAPSTLPAPPPATHEPAAPSAPPPFSIAPATVREHEPGTGLPDDLRVLVVDDDPLVRRALARRFQKHRVTLAENGVAATRALEQSRPDVIVSDLKMPEMDGLALAEEVKRRWPELADRIVFVSGTGSQIQRAEQQATHPVLRKPVEGRQLESRIVEVLEKALPPRKG